jgi:hypothetical protein
MTMYAFLFVLVPLAVVAAWALARGRNRRRRHHAHGADMQSRVRAAKQSAKDRAAKWMLPVPPRQRRDKAMGEIAGAHVVQAQSHLATEPETVFVVSENAEHSQHHEEKITAGGPGSIKILWITPAEAHSLSPDVNNAAVAVEASRKEAEAIPKPITSAGP